MKQLWLSSVLVLSTFWTLLAQNPLTIPTSLSGSQIELDLQMGSVQFFPGMTTSTMGANGNILGPTIILDRYQNVTMNVTNSLDTTTTVHWHGMHVPAEADGGPHVVIPAGSTWSPTFEVKDWASTYWYHPHLHMNTNKHVQKGIAGMIIVKDAEEAALSLPRTYGVDDFPVIVQTKAFDASNQIVIESALDTALLVNGTIHPYLDAPAQWVRLRLLNGSAERYYNFGFAGNLTFKQIGSDGGLLSAPVDLTRVLLAPGERAEIVIDLSSLQGQTIYLKNYGTGITSGIYGAAQPGIGAGQTIPNYTLNPLNGADFNVLQINVVAPSATPVTSISSTLVNHTPWLEANANATKSLTFMPQNMGPTAIQGPFMINNAMFDMNIINYIIPLNNIEVWTLTNESPIGHPFHLHDVSFYVLDINGVAPPLNLQGRKDVIHVPGGMGTVRFITKFEDYANDNFPYMYHCHILTHEDMGMMGQFLVTSNVGIEEQNEGLKIFPNPTSDILTLETSFINSKYTVLDHTGRIVLKGILEEKISSIDVQHLSSGIYFLNVPEKMINLKFIRK